MVNIDTIVISCMDRRLSSYLDKEYNNGNTIFLRNAGANARTLANSIKQLAIANHIKHLIVLPHTDCGAMGYVYNSIKGELKPSLMIEEALVNQFRNIDFEDRADLEEQNADLQRKSLQPVADLLGMDVHADVIDVAKIGVPEHSGKHILTLTDPTTSLYEELLERYRSEQIGIFDSYFIQGRSIKDLSPDISVATGGLHISDVRFIAQAQEQNERFARAIINLQKEPFMKGVKLTLVKHTEKK